MEIILLVFVSCFGIIIGSFLNVCICRIPRNEKVSFPPSHCFHCGHQLGAPDLVPVFSYLFLKGRCRYCSSKISVQYPVIELTSGLLSLGIFLKEGISLPALAAFLFFAGLLVVSVIDLKTMQIPQNMVYVLTVLAVLHGFARYGVGFPVVDAALGAAAGAGILLSLYLLGLFILNCEVIGMGDIKLMIPIGLFLGLTMTCISLYLAVILGGIAAILLVVIKKKSRKAKMAFGPFLCLGAFLAFTFGKEMIYLYYKFVLG